MQKVDVVSYDDGVVSAFLLGHFETVCEHLTAVLDADNLPSLEQVCLLFFAQIRLEDTSQIQILLHKLKLLPKTDYFLPLHALIDIYSGFLSYVNQSGDVTFQEVLTQAERIDHPWVHLFLTYYRYRYYLNEMNFEAALNCLTDLLKRAEALRFTYFVMECYLELAKLHFLRMDLGLSLNYLKRVITAIKEEPLLHHSRLLIPCSGSLIQIHYIVNEPEELYALLDNWKPLQSHTLKHAYSNLPLMIESLTYIRAFEQVSHLISVFKGYAEEKHQKAVSQYISAYLEPFVSLHQAIHNADQGALMQLKHYWDHFIVESLPPHRYSFFLLQKFLVSFYLADYSQALKLLDLHDQRFSVGVNDSLFWVIQNYRAATQSALGEKGLAMTTLIMVIRKAYQSGYLRLFSDHYHGSAELLNQTIETCQNTANPFPYSFLKSLSQAIAKPEVFFVHDFSDREEEVMRYISQDLSLVKIAEALHISKNTVKFHVKNIYKKIGAENKSEARAVIRQYYA